MASYIRDNSFPTSQQPSIPQFSGPKPKKCQGLTGRDCPLHCPKCISARTGRQPLRVLRKPPEAINKICGSSLLTWEPADLCDEHQREWYRLQSSEPMFRKAKAEGSWQGQIPPLGPWMIPPPFRPPSQQPKVKEEEHFEIFDSHFGQRTRRNSLLNPQPFPPPPPVRRTSLNPVDKNNLGLFDSLTGGRTRTNNLQDQPILPLPPWRRQSLESWDRSVHSFPVATSTRQKHSDILDKEFEISQRRTYFKTGSLDLSGIPSQSIRRPTSPIASLAWISTSTTTSSRLTTFPRPRDSASSINSSHSTVSTNNGEYGKRRVGRGFGRR